MNEPNIAFLQDRKLITGIKKEILDHVHVGSHSFDALAMPGRAPHAPSLSLLSNGSGSVSKATASTGQLDLSESWSSLVVVVAKLPAGGREQNIYTVYKL